MGIWTLSSIVDSCLCHVARRYLAHVQRLMR
jgi:hypothetical protein